MMLHADKKTSNCAGAQADHVRSSCQKVHFSHVLFFLMMLEWKLTHTRNIFKKINVVSEMEEKVSDLQTKIHRLSHLTMAYLALVYSVIR